MYGEVDYFYRDFSVGPMVKVVNNDELIIIIPLQVEYLLGSQQSQDWIDSYDHADVSY